MSNPIFAADALVITSSKSANFPLSFEIIKDNHQNALQTTWQVLQTLGQAIDDYHATHGKLILCQFKEDIKAEAGVFSFHRLDDGKIALSVAVSVELLFDFQSHFWERLEAIAITLDFLQSLCAEQQALSLNIHLGEVVLAANKK